MWKMCPNIWTLLKIYVWKYTGPPFSFLNTPILMHFSFILAFISLYLEEVGVDCPNASLALRHWRNWLENAALFFHVSNLSLIR